MKDHFQENINVRASDDGSSWALGTYFLSWFVL